MTSFLVDSVEFLNLFRSSVPHFYYLEERGWFMRDRELQLKLLFVIYIRRGQKVNVVSNNFSEDLDIESKKMI